ncbi:hypothetical protein X943_001045 [Babesia divergens]|uniref:Uncharacterized protein n=1 Tax=Babesia divergens TaxID=32595 RepID=A0AAD9GH85_BABDI|nr:hypothetical protein X943_001045 [Babesia divergens]
MGMPPSPYQVAQQLDRGNHNQAPNAAHIMQGQGSFSSSVIVPAQPQSLAGNGQAMNRRADIATMASIVSPKAVPNHCDQRMMQNGNVPCRPNVAGVSPRTVQGNQVIKRVFDGDDSMNNVKKIMLHHDAMNPRTPVAPSIKRTIFTISKNWKLRLPEQMVFFEFNISGESYKQIQSIISHLHQQTAVHETSKKDTQMFGRKDLQVLMQDKLEIAQASISDAVVFNIMDKLRCLKIALVKKGERQKLLRRHYPDRNCVVLTNFKKHELHCFFGYTTIDNKIKLALYHRTKCDDNPNFICGKETHQFKAVVERQYDLFLQVPGHGIQIILRRLADAHDKSFQVAFGAKSHDVVDLIMYVFNNPLADHQGVPMTSNTMS